MQSRREPLEVQSNVMSACPACQYGPQFAHSLDCPIWGLKKTPACEQQIEELKKFVQSNKPVAAAPPEVKPTNPKDALGTNRIPLDIVSAIAIAEEALAMVEGALKYGRYNYRAVGVRTSIYLGAVNRHLQKYQNGEDRDPKTGVHHLGSARACLGVILDAEAQGKLTDDRPPSNPNMSALLDAFEARVKHLKEVFKEHAPKHYTIADSDAA
jgi:hypothetical protein